MARLEITDGNNVPGNHRLEVVRGSVRVRLSGRLWGSFMGVVRQVVKALVG